MKRFLLFSGADYYPSGGWDDFQGSFDTLEQAIALENVSELYATREWWHVVDLTTGEIVEQG